MNYDATLAALTDEQLYAEACRTYAAFLDLPREERQRNTRTPADRCAMECSQRPGVGMVIWQRAVDWVRKERGLAGVE